MKMKFKGEFLFPDVLISCYYDNFPKIYCDISDMGLENIYIAKNKWRWKIRTETPLEAEELYLNVNENIEPLIIGVEYNSKVPQLTSLSVKQLDDNIFNEINSLMKDLLGIRELVFYDKGSINQVKKESLTRDYKFYSKEEQIEKKEIDAIYPFQHPIKFDCEYYDDHSIKCEFLRDGRGYIPIYENDNHSTPNQRPTYINYLKLHFDISELTTEDENIKVITGMEYRSLTHGWRGRITEEELEAGIFEEFNDLMQYIFAKKKLNEITYKLEEREVIPIDEAITQKITSVKYNVILVGDDAVGKTSIAYRFVKGKHEHDNTPSIGASLLKKECQFEGLKSVVRFNIWDLAGRSLFTVPAHMKKTYLATGEAGIIVFDITKRKTFQSIENYYNELKKTSRIKSIILLGNKKDLENHREVSTDQGEELAHKLDLPYIETSSLTGENINDIFRTLAIKLIKE